MAVVVIVHGLLLTVSPAGRRDFPRTIVGGVRQEKEEFPLLAGS